MITTGDRLGLTVCLAIIIHAIVILGISFAPEDETPALYRSLDIILVQQRSPKPAPKADFLAQASLEGGGDSEHSVRPAAPVSTPLPQPQPALVSAAPETPRPDPKPRTPSPPPRAQPVPQPKPVKKRIEVKVRKAARKLTPPRAVNKTVKKARPSKKPAPAQSKPVPPPLPSAATLINRSFAMASLNAELSQRMEARAKRPRAKYISASTREYRFASYMEAWRAKVERIGNLNYPDEARRKKLSGNLVLDVALKPNGSIAEITILKPSGHKVLDDAAIRIVRLAAPFARFPENIRKDVDILHITRTWKFLNSSRFSGR